MRSRVTSHHASHQLPNENHGYIHDENEQSGACDVTVAIIQYEEEIDRQRKLLDLVLNPAIKEHRIALPKQYTNKEKDTRDQHTITSLDQEHPETTQFTGESEDEQQTPISVEGPARDHQLLSKNYHEAESKDLVRVKCRDSIKLSLCINRQTDLPQQHVCIDKNVCTNENPDNKELLSRLKEEEPQPPQVTEKQEEPFTGQGEEHLELKQETDAVMVTLTYDKVYPSEPDLQRDPQLVFHNFNIAKSRARKRSKHGASVSARTAEPKPTTSKQINDKRSKKKYKSNCSDVHAVTVTDKNAFICGVCGRDCKYKCRYDIHMRTHTGERPYSCKTCGNGFRSKGALLVHTRRHTGERPHRCMLCGSRFLVVSGLKRHMRIHTGEKPFPCEICGKDFRTTTGVKAHMRIHTGEKPYVCQTCGRQFRHSSAHKRHMISHHNSSTC